jgi:hypothetical protein
MNTEITGLTLTEWLFMIGLTLILGVWAYFNHSVIVTQNFGRIDPILLASMLTPGFFFFIKHGETYLRAKGKQALTNQGSYPIIRDSSLAGGETDAVPCDDGIALPQLKFLRTGVSKPTIPALTNPLKYIVNPEKCMMDFGANKIMMADVARYDGESMRTLIQDVRSTVAILPGIVRDEDSLLFGDNLESSWPRLVTHNTKKIYMIPSKPTSTYNIELEHALNVEVWCLSELFQKLKWSMSKLKGNDWFGGNP